MGETESLIRRAREGDERALAALLGEVGPEVSAQIGADIGRQWRGSIEAEDVMQVSYLEAFLQIGRLESEDVGGFAAWLRRIAKNNLRDAIRGFEAEKRPDPRKRQRTQVPTDASYVGLVEYLGATSATPSRAVAADEARAFMDDALGDLPEDYRAVIRMYDLEGRSIGEVSESMGRSAGAVYMLRARAHDALRDQMGAASRFFSQGS